MSDLIHLKVICRGIAIQQVIPGDWVLKYAKVHFFVMYAGGFEGLPEVYINGKLTMDDSLSFKNLNVTEADNVVMMYCGAPPPEKELIDSVRTYMGYINPNTQGNRGVKRRAEDEDTNAGGPSGAKTPRL